MTTKEALEHLVKQFKDDPSYRISWVSNIAVSFCDQTYRYKKRTGKKYLTAVDVHIIANDAANDFLNQLSK